MVRATKCNNDGRLDGDSEINDNNDKHASMHSSTLCWTWFRVDDAMMVYS